MSPPGSARNRDRRPGRAVASRAATRGHRSSRAVPHRRRHRGRGARARRPRSGAPTRPRVRRAHGGNLGVDLAEIDPTAPIGHLRDRQRCRARHALLEPRPTRRRPSATCPPPISGTFGSSAPRSRSPTAAGAGPTSASTASTCTRTPGSFRDFVDGVVPELRQEVRRRLIRRMGQARSAAGCWARVTASSAIPAPPITGAAWRPSAEDEAEEEEDIGGVRQLGPAGFAVFSSVYVESGELTPVLAAAYDSPAGAVRPRTRRARSPRWPPTRRATSPSPASPGHLGSTLARRPMLGKRRSATASRPAR